MFLLPMGMTWSLLQLNPPSFCPPRNFTFRDFKSAYTASILNHFRKCDWFVFGSESLLETRLSCLYTHVDDPIGRYVPVKTIHHNGKRQPWFTDELKKNNRGKRPILYLSLCCFFSSLTTLEMCFIMCFIQSMPMTCKCTWLLRSPNFSVMFILWRTMPI